MARLVDIPDFPEAPLPAWKHYGTTDFAGKHVQKALDRISYSGYLIGLQVLYTIIETRKTYRMAFGKVEDTDTQGDSFPLDDKFLSDWFKAVDTLLRQNLAHDPGAIYTEFAATVSGSVRQVRVACRLLQEGDCPLHHTGFRICKSLDGGNHWRCLHTKCKNT